MLQNHNRLFLLGSLEKQEPSKNTDKNKLSLVTKVDKLKTSSLVVSWHTCYNLVKVLSTEVFHA